MKRKSFVQNLVQFDFNFLHKTEALREDPILYSICKLHFIKRHSRQCRCYILFCFTVAVLPGLSYCALKTAILKSMLHNTKKQIKNISEILNQVFICGIFQCYKSDLLSCLLLLSFLQKYINLQTNSKNVLKYVNRSVTRDCYLREILYIHCVFVQVTMQFSTIHLQASHTVKGFLLMTR